MLWFIIKRKINEKLKEEELTDEILNAFKEQEKNYLSLITKITPPKKKRRIGPSELMFKKMNPLKELIYAKWLFFVWKRYLKIFDKKKILSELNIKENIYSLGIIEDSEGFSSERSDEISYFSINDNSFNNYDIFREKTYLRNYTKYENMYETIKKNEIFYKEKIGRINRSVTLNIVSKKKNKNDFVIKKLGKRNIGINKEI